MRRFLARMARPWLLVDPLRAPERNPLLALCFVGMAVAVFGTAAGRRPLPGSLDTVPDIVGQAVCIVMVAGCIIAVIGIVFPDGIGRDRSVPIELAGTLLVGAGWLCYGYAVYHASAIPANVVVVLGWSVGFWLGSGARAVQVVAYVLARRRLRGSASGGPP